MKVSVSLFAGIGQIAGCDHVELELPEGADVARLRSALIQRLPAAADLLQQSLFAVNAQYVADDTPLTANGEIACIPPVSGG